MIKQLALFSLLFAALLGLPSKGYTLTGACLAAMGESGKPSSVAVARSERTRIEIKNKLELLDNEAVEAKTEAYDEFRRTLETTHREGGVGSIAPQTFEALRAYVARDRSSTDTNAEQRKISALLKQDPYFSWLVAYHRPINGETKRLGYAGVEAMLYSHLGGHGPNFLSVELAIVRLQRDLDPLLTDKQTGLAVLILKLEQILFVHRSIAAKFDSAGAATPTEQTAVMTLLEKTGSIADMVHAERSKAGFRY